jgi:hypothetical protein
MQGNALLPLGNGMPSVVHGAVTAGNILLSVGKVIESGSSVIHDVGNAAMSAFAMLSG